MKTEQGTAMLPDSAEYEILPAGQHGKTTCLIVACWRLLAAFWALLALLLTVIAVALPPILAVLVALRGKNPFPAILVPLAGSLLGGAALFFGLPAVRAYALLVRPTRMISLRNLTVKYLASGFVFSILGASAVFLVYRKPEEKLIYGAYVLFGIVVFAFNHAFRKKGYAWQRLPKGNGDDEIDWELREKLEQENKAEMEAQWGPGLVRLMAQAARSVACAEIIGDERLSEEARLLKVRALFPDFTEQEFRERLSAMRIDRDATMIARDPQLDENEKISRIALLYPNMKHDSIRVRINEMKEEQN